MIISATEIKIKGVFGFLHFIVNLGWIKVQLRNTDGLVFQKYKDLFTLDWLRKWRSFMVLILKDNSQWFLR